MELAEAVARRRMTRRFDPDGRVAETTLAAVLHAMGRGPSAGFSQGTDLLVLTTQDERRAYWAATLERPVARTPVLDGDAWLAGVSAAPALVLLVADPQAYRARYAAPDKVAAAARGAGDLTVPWWDVDTGMAGMLGLLAATDAGLGALFFGVPPRRWDAVRQAFGIPAGRRLVGALALGHPASGGRAGHAGSGGSGGAGARRRRDIVHRGRW